MNCRSAESLFSSYVEDEISQEERRNLESHLMAHPHPRSRSPARRPFR